MAKVWESPKQYSARHLRRAIERAKSAVMEAQETLQDFRGRPATYQELLDAAFGRLDTAWRMASETEQHEAQKVRERARDCVDA
jgi:hypothetical protein